MQPQPGVNFMIRVNNRYIPNDEVPPNFIRSGQRTRPPEANGYSVNLLKPFLWAVAIAMGLILISHLS